MSNTDIINPLFLSILFKGKLAEVGLKMVLCTVVMGEITTSVNYVNGNVLFFFSF